MRPDLRSIRPLCAAIDVDTVQGAGIDENRRLYCLSVSITSFPVVTRRLSVVEVRGVDGSVARQIEQFQRESELLSPETHRRSIKRLAQCGWAGELAAFEDFDECRLHVKPENMQDSVLPAGNGVAGRMADLHHRCISTLSCYRDSLVNEAE